MGGGEGRESLCIMCVCVTEEGDTKERITRESKRVIVWCVCGVCVVCVVCGVWCVVCGVVTGRHRLLHVLPSANWASA